MTNIIREGWRGIVVSICVSIALMTGARALHAEIAPNVVGLSEQSARDEERLRILRDELKRSEALLEALGRRRAERLAAADMSATDEAEDQRRRTLGDIAALKREIASASRANQEAPARPQTAAARPSRPSAGKSAPPRPWWDVYGKSQRAEVSSPSPSPLSFASPPVEAGARSVSAHRLE